MKVRTVEAIPVSDPEPNDSAPSGTLAFAHMAGRVSPPTAPGLGIAVIDEVVDAYRSDNNARH